MSSTEHSTSEHGSTKHGTAEKPDLSGLTSAEVEERTRAGRTNKATRTTGRTTWEIIRANVFTRINAMLGVLCVIVLATGSWINAAFGLLIIANSAVGIIQELRAKRTLENLKILSESRPRVIRDGEEREVAQSEIVEGDLIRVGSGDEIVVDGPLLSGSLSMDESQLTGEADPVRHNPGDELLSGSFVKHGSGVFRAEKVGGESYAARLAAEASDFSLTDSVLMSGINSILRVITWLLIPTGLLTIFTQLTRTDAPIRESILSMAAALVPMVPEGLVLMTSIAFAVGIVRLGKYKALVNELVAIEGLARVDTMCTDKTGTLTSNEMELEAVVDEHGDDASAETLRDLRRLFASQSDLNNTAEAIVQGLDEWSAGEGEQEDVAAGSSQPQSSQPHAFEGSEIPFSSAYKFSGFRVADGPTFVLGAPDVLLDQGTPAADVAAKEEADGRRVLAFGRALDEVEDPDEDGANATTPELGDPVLIVLRQKLRPDVAETLAYFEHEGVDVKIISGDNPGSVAAVAKEATGEQLSSIDAREIAPEDMEQAVLESEVFGRVKPEQKQAMVEALHARGRTVAMTGDGVNDVLALKKADIGVAMGSGSAATRSVAQLVLLNDRFSSMPHVIAEGRRVIGNIERVANLFLTKTVYSVVLAMVVAVAGVTFPFQPIHVTITGWFTIGIPAFILSLAPNTERPKDGFVRRVLSLAIPGGAIVGLGSVIMWLVIYPGDGASVTEQRQAGTAVLLALIIMGLWVLNIVARPLKTWKWALWFGCIGGYLVLFLIAPIRELVLLDIGNTRLMITGAVVGLCGAVVIEFSQFLARRFLLHQD
ncbi:HAD-IC family P-type ATPase [Corynebacterium sp. HMSC27B11]|uniref:HAD-IC family P-type ATPase n=1 Tax=Corynebacterium sp. HMSC27B11 TaxID=1581065 RepID=UPI0008A13987|nr:HAD-IC family P-type ATPase [Corynebacterium sp. HMSC27B11]OFS17137.1 magnesium-transporting ATPase [Corynebacterium sp. HMSC27B11]